MDNNQIIENGIVTEYWDNHNYGGNLQAFALQKFVSENIGSCEQLSYDHEYKSLFSLFIKLAKG